MRIQLSLKRQFQFKILSTFPFRLSILLSVNRAENDVIGEPRDGDGDGDRTLAETETSSIILILV